MDEQNIKADPHWSDLLTEREVAAIRLANVYSDHYAEAGIPGHNQLLLISKLAEMLNRVTEKTGIDVPALYEPEV